MNNQTGHGAMLILGSAILLLMSVIHPSAVPFGDSAALARMAVIDALAHGLAIVGAWLVLVGLVGLSRLLGFQRVTVTAALVAIALATAGIVVAAACDGFVVPKLAEQWSGADSIARDTLKELVRFCVLLASSLTRIYLLLGTTAMALWSWAIHRDGLSRSLPWVGVAVAVAGFATLFGGPAYVNVHELLALVLGQSVWMILAGLMLIKHGKESPPVT